MTPQGYSDWTTLRRLGRLLRPHAVAVAVALSAMTLASAGLLALPLTVREMLERSMSAQPVPPGPGLMVTMAVILGALGLAAYCAAVLLHEVARKVCAALRVEYVARWLRASVRVHREAPAGELAERLNVSLHDIDWFIKSSLGNFLGVLFLMAGGVFMLFWMSWRLALVTALIAPVTVAVLRLIENEGRRLLRLGRMEGEKMAGILHSMILGLDVIKAFVAEHREAERFRRQQDRLLRVQRRESYVASLVEPVLIAAGAATFMFVVFFAGRFIAQGTMTAAEFITFLVYMMFVLPNVRTLGLQLARWRHVKVALEFLDDASRMEPESDLPGCVALPRGVRGSLEFRGVHYHHAGRQRGLRGVSFSVDPGEQVGIVGASGAGKSTILHLLLRFYDPSGGSILVGGEDIARCTRSSVRDAISYVPQDVLLFDGTILDNLRLGRPDASEEEIREVCRAAQAWDFIGELPEGLLTQTGDRGLKLSSGQRQRLAIARALLKPAPLLLLDEATSALDPATEVLFGSALRGLAGERTMLIVAHRLSTVAGLPRIIFLHDGVVAGDGSHAELTAGSAAYRQVTGAIAG